MQGSLLLHRDGLTLGQNQYGVGAVGLVKAKGVKGAKVVNSPGVKTDYRGYAIVPYLQPYRYNDVQIDTSTITGNADINSSVIKTVPTNSAIVLIDYEGRKGYRAYLTVNYQGTPIPFGTEVFSQTNQATALGIANENGEVYLNGLKTEEALFAKLPENKRCTFSVNMNDIDFKNTIGIQTVNCI